MIKKLFIFAVISTLGLSSSFGQNASGQVGKRIITTAVPFLTITPDSRAGAMGDVGVATNPDAYSVHWNAAKLPFYTFPTKFGETGKTVNHGLAISYTPWLRRLINDMYITNVTGFTHLKKNQVIALSMNYFDLGEMQFTDENGDVLKDYNPKEYYFAGSYSMKLSNNLGIAGGIKFIHSNLSGEVPIGGSSGGTTSKPGNTAAVDMSIFYKSKDFYIQDRLSNFALGATITNLGGKISYTNDDDADFIPANLRLGGALNTNIDEHNKISLAIDVNKLLVPTTPVYLQNAAGTADSLDANDQKIIESGKDPNIGVMSAVFSSFTDAPDGFSEELAEFMLSVGLEYWYDDLFAVRAGYFNESAIKGNRKYFTLGLGIRYEKAGFDFAYLIPQQQNNPLSETLRFSLSFNFAKKNIEMDEK